jgi:hypothetical protein
VESGWFQFSGIETSRFLIAVLLRNLLQEFNKHSNHQVPGGVAEWSCSGLQSRVRRFDSDPRLQQFNPDQGAAL